MSASLDATRLHAGDDVTILDVRCHAARGHGTTVEVADHDEIVLPRRGAFVRTARGVETFADAGVVLFFNRGEPYRVSHPLGGGDECTVLRFAPAMLGAAVVDASERPPESGSPRFATPAGPASPAAWLALQRLRGRLARCRASALEADEESVRLLDFTLAASVRGRRHARQPHREATRGAHRDAAHAVRALIGRDVAARPRLRDLAEAVQLSPHHLVRLFARETGAPIHRHLLRLRLRAALDRLSGGDADLTDLALELGFSSHAHFTGAFVREFGVAPSEFRRALRDGGSRKARKIVEAAETRRA